MDERSERPDSEEGLTLIEVIAVVAVLGILALIGLPMVSCQIQKSRWSSAMNDLMKTRDLIELYEMELGRFPPSLQAAYGDRPVPDTVVYCVDPTDANKGHGNEECTFFDEDNPSGNNNHGGMPGMGYILRTVQGIAPCSNVNFAFLSCCGTEPDVVHCDEEAPSLGHPKNDEPRPCPGSGNGQRQWQRWGNGNGNGEAREMARAEPPRPRLGPRSRFR